MHPPTLAVCLSGALAVLLAGPPETAAVRVWEGSTEIPTYAEGPANPNPPFDLFALGRVN